MSTSEEEAAALRQAQDFLLGLSSGQYRVTSIRALRQDARTIARHFPLAAAERWLAAFPQLNKESVVTVECSSSHHATDRVVHLAGPHSGGGTRPILCGFDRFARDEYGNPTVGFSIGGGSSGSHAICARCAELADGRPIRGMHAGLFPPHRA